MEEQRRNYTGEELNAILNYSKDAIVQESTKEECDELSEEVVDNGKINIELRDKQLNTGTYYIENSDRHYSINSVTMLDDNIPVIHLGLGYWMYHDVWKKFSKKRSNIEKRIGNNLKQLKVQYVKPIVSFHKKFQDN